MPIQTTKKANIYYPDGALVSVKASGDSSYTDLGAINGAVSATVNWDENRVETANAGTLPIQIKNMTISGGFELMNLEPAGIAKMGGGILSTESTLAAVTISADDQSIVSGDYVDKGIVNLSIVEDEITLKSSGEPVLNSITGTTDGVLTEDTDYTLFADTNSPSGYSIMPIIGSNLTTVDQSLLVDYSSLTPIASTKVNAGTSSQELSAYAMKITHTDDNDKIRELELHSVDPTSGGFQFNFLGASEDGVETMPITYQARLDTTKTSGKQLMTWTVEADAS